MLFRLHRRLALGRGACVIGRVPGVLKGNGIEKLGVFNRESLFREAQNREADEIANSREFRNDYLKFEVWSVRKRVHGSDGFIKIILEYSGEQ